VPKKLLCGENIAHTQTRAPLDSQSWFYVRTRQRAPKLRGWHNGLPPFISSRARSELQLLTHAVATAAQRPQRRHHHHARCVPDVNPPTMRLHMQTACKATTALAVVLAACWLPDCANALRLRFDPEFSPPSISTAASRECTALTAPTTASHDACPWCSALDAHWLCFATVTWTVATVVVLEHACQQLLVTTVLCY
jgi:hypothetical protein